uniref:Uncharacterized protein n=1 Tax=Anguilla anguilla TaxID=7936 RepID=A0A0E9XCH3_ANGAN
MFLSGMIRYNKKIMTGCQKMNMTLLDSMLP